LNGYLKPNVVFKILLKCPMKGHLLYFSSNCLLSVHLSNFI
jgi:hypothetical protein